MGRSWPGYAARVAFAAALAGLASAPAAAQCAFCGITPGDPVKNTEAAPLEIELETTLDFDRIIVDGDGGGAVRLSPDGLNEISGAVEQVSGRARIGRVVIHGEPNRAVYVSFPERIELVGMAGTVIEVRSLVTNLPASPTLDSSGRLVVDFGGELEVHGGADGQFRGNIIIRADYL